MANTAWIRSDKGLGESESRAKYERGRRFISHVLWHSHLPLSHLTTRLLSTMTCAVEKGHFYRTSSPCFQRPTSPGSLNIKMDMTSDFVSVDHKDLDFTPPSPLSSASSSCSSLNSIVDGSNEKDAPTEPVYTSTSAIWFERLAISFRLRRRGH